MMHKTIIKTETTFGQGDSTTKIWAECPKCNKKTEVLMQWGFPALYDKMREVQDLLNNTDCDGAEF